MELKFCATRFNICRGSVINAALKTGSVSMIKTVMALPTHHCVLLATFSMKFRDNVGLTRRFIRNGSKYDQLDIVSQ
jgi:hypothetical protein